MEEKLKELTQIAESCDDSDLEKKLAEDLKKMIQKYQLALEQKQAKDDELNEQISKLKIRENQKPIEKVERTLSPDRKRENASDDEEVEAQPESHDNYRYIYMYAQDTGREIKSSSLPPKAKVKVSLREDLEFKPRPKVKRRQYWECRTKRCFSGLETLFDKALRNFEDVERELIAYRCRRIGYKSDPRYKNY